MKAKKLVAVGLAAVMATASMGTTAFADGLELEAHPDQTYYMVTFLSGYSFWTECWRGFQDAAKMLGVEAKYGGTTEWIR